MIQRQRMAAILVVALGATALVPVLGAQGTVPTKAELEWAVAEGKATKKPWELRRGLGEGGAAGVGCSISGTREGGCGYGLVLRGPLGRVVTASASAAKKYLAFTVDSITDSLRAPVLEITVEPGTPLVAGGRAREAPTPEHVVLIPISGKDEGPPVQPLSVSTFPLVWTNLVGGERRGQGLVARFGLDQVPAGDFWVVVVTTGVEARYQITKKHREMMR